jgi:FkbM family methyltransferase
MLIPIRTLSRILNIKPIGVLHVGAHNAEEASDYEKFNWGKVIWIEAQENLSIELLEKLDPDKHKVINVAAWSLDGVQLTFNLASNGQSSSLFEMGTHIKNYPNISVVAKYQVVTSRLDTVLAEEDFFDFINLDVQGAELEVLIGLGNYLATTNWVYTEVNKEDVYKDCAKIDEIDQFLSRQGFKRIATRWVPFSGWGDALYVRNGYKNPNMSRLILLFIDFVWSCTQLLRATIRLSWSFILRLKIGKS